jgi:hypothetical protein
MATQAVSSLRDQIVSLEREIAQLDAKRLRQPPSISMSSSASPRSAPERSPKTSQQLKLEKELTDLRGQEVMAIAALHEETDRASFEAQVTPGNQPPADEKQVVPQPTSTTSDGVAAPPPDPLEPARERGARLRDLLAFAWPGSRDPYVSDNLAWLLRIAATRARDERFLRPRHVLDILLYRWNERLLPSGKKPSMYLPRMSDFLRQVAGADALELGHFEFPSDQAIEIAADGVVIGPELVTILLRASSLCARTNEKYRDAGVRHFLVALMLEEIGRIAIDSVGLARQGFERLRDAFAEMIEGDAPYYAQLGDDPKSWMPIIAEMRQLSPPRRNAGETHAFASDRPRGGVDLLGIEGDAAALADLLLLKDLEAPVAVGVFGSWGSGKSTLINMIREKIAERTRLKKDQAKVVQIKFDAWSHADAENLWASLTAELFDQLADAIDDREPGGKLKEGLITEIAKRLRKDAEALPSGEKKVEDQRDKVRRAETALTRLEYEPVAATVAGEMAKELLAEATPLSAEEKKKPEKAREAKQAEENKKQLDEVLEACGVPKDERDPEKLAPILSGLFELPSRATLLLVLLRGSVGRGVAYGLGAALVVLFLGAGGAVGYLGLARFPEIWTYVVSGLPSLTVLGTVIGAAGVTIRRVAPILRLAADFLDRKEKRAAELSAKRRAAAEALKTERETLAALIAEQTKATEFAATYGVAAEGRSREGLLRYFISFSPELVEVRKKLGLLATVRRCFETLEQIMHEKREPAEGKTAVDDRAGETSSAAKAEKLAHVPDLRRIIVYIDDLDRCSEQHVVQVLQAIHLLLAFDLFVVVVAVDARWLHRAVGQVYSGQLAAPGEKDKSNSATVADYLEKIFQLPIWMRPIGDPMTVDRFVRGIDKPEQEPGGSPPLPTVDEKRDGTDGSTITAVAAPHDPALVQTAAQRRATMSEPERRALAAMAPLAGKSPRGLKRLVNTYRLIRVMRGPAGIADLERGGAGKAPLYPYLLFALACEVGLKTETASSVAEIAGGSAPDGEVLPLVHAVFAGSAPLERLEAEGALEGMRTALRAVYLAAGGRDPALAASAKASSPWVEQAFKVRGERFTEAFAEAARFTFRPRSG